MKICIIGTGLSGLATALRLAETSTNEIIIIEKNEIAGGCLSSKQYGQYILETLYHHCFSGDRNLFKTLEDLSLKEDLLWLKGSTGQYVNGVLYPLTTPIEILQYPCLSLSQKIKLGIFTLSSRKINIDELDSITAKEYLYEKVGDEIYTAFFEPLLTCKFGSAKDTVSAAWLMSRIAIRSDRGVEGEKLGYIKGGWHRLIEAMINRLEEKNVTIQLNTPATTIQYDNQHWLVNGIEYDAIVSTIPPQILHSLMDKNTSDMFSFKDIPYQGAACMTLGLTKDPSKGIYWSNIGDNAPYGSVVTHTNFVPYEWYGEHVVYLASYFKDFVPNDLKEQMINDFCKRFSIEKQDINHADLFIDPYAGPVYTTGYKKNIPSSDQGHNLYLAGMFSLENYPERSIEGSISAGIHVAELIVNKGNDA